MIDLGVLFGSRTTEHDVSIVSGLQLIENCDRTKYNPFPVYISREGEWFVGEPLSDIKTYSAFDPGMKGITRVVLPPTPKMKGLYALEGGGILNRGAKKAQNIDCAILALHGMHGEDGTVQGLLELADIPYSSCGLVGSAVGMDKIVMKAVFKSMGIPVVDSIYCYRRDWRESPEKVILEAESLGYPLFVKPANLGSSIGISRADDRVGLARAIEIAASFDRRILIERAVKDAVEINCACVGFDGEATPSLCEQPIAWDQFLSFEDKYTRSAGKGMASLSRRIPAPISDALTERIREYTVRIFRMLECKGVVRIDYMIDPATEVVNVCEINTIPGSFAFYLFEPMGVSYKELIDKLVGYAYQALEQKRESSFAYRSDILSKALSGAKIIKK